MKSFLSLILFGLLTSGLFSQTGTEVRVTGTVTDMSGMPLPGVNVIVKGTSTGTSTDFDGLFNLDVPSSSTLVFSFLGFQTQEIAVNGTADLNVQLVEDTSTLDEVVVATTNKIPNTTPNTIAIVAQMQPAPYLCLCSSK